MMIVAMLSWWYAAGWVSAAKRAGRRVDAMLETFSVSLLLKTLFEPFRQISAGGTSRTSFDAQVRAFGDKLFSRVFGAFVRLLFIIIGSVAALFAGLFGIVELIVWPFVPLLPFIGITLTVMGWKP